MPVAELRHRWGSCYRCSQTPRDTHLKWAFATDMFTAMRKQVHELVNLQKAEWRFLPKVAGRIKQGNGYNMTGQCLAHGKFSINTSWIQFCSAGLRRTPFKEGHATQVLGMQSAEGLPWSETQGPLLCRERTASWSLHPPWDCLYPETERHRYKFLAILA